MARSKTVHVIEYANKGANLKVPLKLVTERGCFSQAPEFEYIIHLDEPLAIHLTGKDPEELTKELYKKLDAYFEISWVPYLYVRVGYNCGGRSRYCSSETTKRAVAVEIDYVLIGTRPDGNKVHDFYDGSEAPHSGHHIPRYNDYSKGVPETSPLPQDLPSWGDVSSRALVLDTPANRAALSAIHTEMTKLAIRLGEVLAPDTLQNTLASMSALQAIGFKG